MKTPTSPCENCGPPLPDSAMSLTTADWYQLGCDPTVDRIAAAPIPHRMFPRER